MRYVGVSISYYEMDTFTSLKQTEIIPHNSPSIPLFPTYIINIQLPTRRTTKYPSPRPTTAQASPRSQGSARLRFWRYWISMRCKNAPRRPHQIIWGRRGHAKNSPDYQQLTKESRAESLTATRSEVQKLLLSNLRNILFCQAGHIQNSIHV